MSKASVKKSFKFPVEKLGGWDALIAEAKQRIQDLEFSIKVFERKKSSGESCTDAKVKSDSELIRKATA